MEDLQIVFPEETILKKILVLRNKKVMLDKDLAELYGVETKVLKQQVRRNSERFPEDFMFELSKREMKLLAAELTMYLKKYLINSQ